MQLESGLASNITVGGLLGMIDGFAFR